MSEVLNELYKMADLLELTPIGRKFRKYIPEFRRWLEKYGIYIIDRLMRSPNHVATSYPDRYVVGQLRAGDLSLIINLFGGWLYANKLTTSHYLVTSKYVKKYDKIYKWAKVVREVSAIQ